MKCYSHIPQSIHYKDIENKKYSLSSSQYKLIEIPNPQCIPLRDLLKRPLKKSDLGQEVGSNSYIGSSPYRFIRTKALQEDSLLLDINDESALPILPSEFVQMNLKEGDLLISKDSNIGEIAILERDYPNFMLSGAIYNLPIKDYWRYYALSFIKNSIFREQLDSMVPKGATIRHAKTMFLDCLVPMPKVNTERTVAYVSEITKALINKEMHIKKRYQDIIGIIQKEIDENQTPNVFNYRMPSFDEITAIGRLDTGLYCVDYKLLDYKLRNYKKGAKTLKDRGYKVLRGPNLAVSVIGPTHYADDLISDKYYKLIQGVDLSEYGTVVTERYMGNKNEIQLLKEGDILFSAEGSIGKVFITIDLKDKAITNYHGMTITNDSAELFEKCFIGCMFFWFRKNGWFDFYSVGGQGGSFGKEKTENLIIPNFPIEKQKELAKMYHNGGDYHYENYSLPSFSKEDEVFNINAGIYELDKSAKLLKRKLNKALDDIINNREVRIDLR